MGSVQDDSLPSPVTVRLSELEEGSVSLDRLEAAFGPRSLGILLVTDLPSSFPQLRHRVLASASALAALPDAELCKLERPDARYNIGWSCGKETLRDGRPDTLKGSFYAQPFRDVALEARARAFFPDLPDMTAENAWPDESMLPGFRADFERLCSVIVDVAALVARSCDRYGVARLDGYEPGTLEAIVRTSVSTKARLLHYFPPPPAAEPATDGNSAAPAADDDDWCGTHTDLGALTGLTSQMFLAEPAPSSPSELPSHPSDLKAGLWIRDRAGRAVPVEIPRDALAFQTGLALELLTHRRFPAVPHFVRAAKGNGCQGVARNTLALFTQPNLWDVVEDGKDARTFGEVAREVFGRTA